MAYDVADALDLLDLAVGRAAEFVEPEAVAPAAELAAGIRNRVGFLGRSVVVALVGGTGSGKSSILNALAGEPIAQTGVRRPTTERPLAWIPANPEPGLTRLLDELGIEDRVGHDSFGEIVLLDLPDTDSVVGSHRDMVEYLLPRVDAIAWVVDPEKYNDRLLHREFLEPLRAYSPQFLFVLNQVDRLSPPEERQVLDDLERVLAEDGISDPQVIAVAADPASGSPVGIERLSRDLRARFEAKRVVMAKVIADLRRARDGIAEVTGIGRGEGTAYDERWHQVAGVVTEEIVGSGIEGEDAAIRAGQRKALAVGGGPVRAAVGWFRSTRFSKTAGLADPADSVRLKPGAQVTHAASIVSELVANLSFETGGSFGRLLRSEVDPDGLEREIGRAVEAASLDVGEFRITTPSPWWRMAGFVQWLMAVVFIVGVIWIWADPVNLRPGGDIRPLSLVVGSTAVAFAVRMLIVDSGKRTGKRELDLYRDRLRVSVRDGLDRRVGGPIRQRMRSRAEIAGGLSEIGLVTAALEEALDRS